MLYVIRRVLAALAWPFKTYKSWFSSQKLNSIVSTIGFLAGLIGIVLLFKMHPTLIDEIHGSFILFAFVSVFICFLVTCINMVLIYRVFYEWGERRKWHQQNLKF